LPGARSSTFAALPWGSPLRTYQLHFLLLTVTGGHGRCLPEKGPESGAELTAVQLLRAALVADVFYI